MMGFRVPRAPWVFGEQSEGEAVHEVAHETAREPERVTLSDDEIFDVLRNSRRRIVLSYLLRAEGEASLAELTDRVATEEYDVAVEELSSQQRNCVYTGLSQCHLPRMDELGVIDFDADAKTATLRDPGRGIESYLGHDGGTDAVRPVLSVAVVVAAVVTLGVAGVGPLGDVSVTTWALFTAVALFGVALFQLSV